VLSSEAGKKSRSADRGQRGEVAGAVEEELAAEQTTPPCDVCGSPSGMLTQVHQQRVLGLGGLMSEDARGLSIESAKAVVCVSGCRSIALVATLLVWWCAGLGVPANTARADDCLTAPNSPAPTGSHWYFRPDRAKQRNCWYLAPSPRGAATFAAG
jgi:hypothetical protein